MLCLNLWCEGMEEHSMCDMGRDTGHLIFYKQRENEDQANGAGAC